jgi:uracil-xanthine permease
MIDWNWRLHGDGRQVRPGEVVAPDERLSWPRTIGIGAQHVLAMFGATFLVPLLTGFPPATTLFFSGVGTILFLLITRNQLPSYLGSSFAFIAPVVAATTAHGRATALGGIVVTGVLFAIVGLIVHKAGTGWIEWLMPPVVTGAIVALIGLNLAPVAKSNFVKQPATALVTLVVILLVTVVFRGIVGRLSILMGVLAGYLAAALQGQLDFTAVRKAAWVGLPDFTTPRFDLGVVALFIPVVLVLIAENVGHVKAVASMTGRPLDHLIGRAFIGDGIATTLAGAGGGSGTTTYAENIGVMAATRVYSTAAYWVAGVVALLLGLSPKFGALINTIPAGVLGGATVVLYGLIGILGARIWVQARVDFANPANLMTAAVALIIGIADFTWKIGSLLFNGIALGSVAAVVVYHVMRQIGIRRGTVSPVDTLPEPARPATTAAGQRGQSRRRRRP